MAFHFWTLHDLRSPAAKATYLGLFIIGLGISRLAFDSPQRDPLDRAGALALAACFPPLEIGVNSAVTLLPVPPPVDVVQGNKTLLTENPPSARLLKVVAAGPLILDIPGASLPAAGQLLPLSGKPLLLSKARGNVEFRVEGALLLRRGGVNFLLQSIEPLRFGPADDVIYEIESDARAQIIQSGDVRQAMVPAGTVLGSLALGSGQALATLQPVSVSYWVADTPPTLMPVRVSGQPGLADIAIEANQSGINFSAQGVTIAACVLRDRGASWAASRDLNWLRAGVAQTAPGVPGSARVMVALPSNVLPVAYEFSAPLRVAVASSDGRYIALGGFHAIGRLYAALGATCLTGMMLGGVMYARGQRLKARLDGPPRWFSGMFIGADGEPSLSLMQIFVWTSITMWGFFYVFIVAGNLLTMATEMMGLLGIAGAGSVLARWIATGTGVANTPACAVTAVLPPQSSGDSFWRMLSTNGTFDLLKFQLFAFTVVISMYVIWRIADAAAFPVLDSNTLLLMGVSQGVYVSGKLAAGTSPPKI
ncbi:hypothetical protein [Janthinobacterium agaricidamnosum]|uniref:Putative membrane protein n=1 Tax=Janthinobacterium agaricidamnosum NBRC 102515 = DSM 9628 TaxID=1349767 RepID=W0V4Z6_9BURK|nr:hypothetical protein [Janthinobacterium agaricidamnosum]CDG82423.1 putative membrane protein [Janthinobacterium agaricidamnosum NBRC 102515 = DSM 9628]